MHCVDKVETRGINGTTSPDQDEIDSQLHIDLESHSPIKERIQQLIQDARLTKQEQLEQMTSMKHDQLQQARSMSLIKRDQLDQTRSMNLMKQDQAEIKRYIKLQVMILFPIIFVFIFRYLTKY